jgi:tetratricopeptide (TPR) repeat protein
MPDTPITIFISYARTDTNFVNHLEADLQMRSFRTWVDRRKLEGGQDWLDGIQQAIEQCQVLLVVLSPDAVASKYVRMEYRHALRMGKLVIPLQYRLCPKVPIDLNDIQWVDFTQPYEEGLNQLLIALAQLEQTESEIQQQSPLPTQVQTLLTSEEDEPELVAPQPAPPPPEPDSIDLYLAGVKARSEGDLERAIALWQQLFDRDPDFQNGTFASQREKVLQRLHPQRVDRLREIAEEASKAGEWGREISSWEALLKLAPNDKQAKRRLALARENQKYAWHYENALRFVQEGQLSLAKTELEMLWDDAPYFGDPANLAQQIDIQRGIFGPADYDTEAMINEEEAEIRKKTISGFVKLELATSPLLTWAALFCLLSGTGSAIGVLTHSWLWSTGTVGLVMILAYLLGYRRAVHPLMVIGIAVISSAIAFGLAEYGSTFAAAQQLSNAWGGNQPFWDGRQLDSGLLVGIVVSIITSIIEPSSAEASLRGFSDALGNGLVGGLIVGPFFWAVLALVFTASGWGFGFGPGWYIALIGLVICTASGVGVYSWWLVYLKAFN